MTTSPGHSQTPNCTNDLKDLTLSIHSSNALNGHPTNNNLSSVINGSSGGGGSNTSIPSSSTISNNALTAATASSSSYSPAVFNSFTSHNAFDSKSALSLSSPSYLNGHHAAYGGYTGPVPGSVDFSAGGYHSALYPGSNAVLGKSHFTVPHSAPSPGEKCGKSNKRSTAGKSFQIIITICSIGRHPPKLKYR